MHNPCAVIPVYNHEHALPVVVAALHQAGLPCVLVDDASSPACAAVMDQLATQANTYLVDCLDNSLIFQEGYAVHPFIMD